jgi:hemolysin III
MDTRHGPREERLNALSHGVALMAVLAGAPLLLLRAAQRGDPWVTAGTLVFVLSAALLYAASTLYHALPAGPAKHAVRVLDHASIYLLIAGTYTPFTLGVLRGAWGWTLFGLVWSLALAGVTFKVVAGFRFPLASTMVYLGMGWLVLLAIGPVVALVPRPGIALLVAGGLAYTGGVAFYASRRPYAHAVWHLFVAAGTACHAVAVGLYA